MQYVVRRYIFFIGEKRRRCKLLYRIFEPFRKKCKKWYQLAFLFAHM